MANSREKKKLSSKQANIISFIVSMVYLIFAVIRGLILISSGMEDVDILMYLLMSCFLPTVFIYFVLYYFIFKGYDKECKERDQKIQVKIEDCLSKTDYTQVYFLCGKSDIMNMITQILQKEGCKFYAKLTENNNIHLIAKDKNDEEVYSVEIEKPYYFRSNFKFNE